jgi:hypothetical protein
MQLVGLLYAYRIPCGTSKNVAINELCLVNYKREREFVACLAPNNTNTLNPKVICEITLSSGPSLTL